MYKVTIMAPNPVEDKGAPPMFMYYQKDIKTYAEAREIAKAIMLQSEFAVIVNMDNHKVHRLHK